MKYLYVLTIFFSLSACQATKDALTLKKKSSADEFLVEKKSPLVLPPNYGDLPLPDGESINDKKKETKETFITLGDDKVKMGIPVKDSNPTPLEKSVLEKIK